VTVGGKDQGVHRVMYEFFNGKIPEGMCVLHKCDTPLCCNPQHLFIGTRADNNRDAKEKGRTSCGENKAISKLTDEAVREIRLLAEQGAVTQMQMAQKFGVSRTVISRVIGKRIWKHVK
jgi:predicted XRE-type DNA-binding protein